MNIALWLMLLPQLNDSPVQIVREGFLPDLSEYAHVALVFEDYAWFEKYSWTSQPEGDKHKVTFQGIIDDAVVVDDFHKKNRFSLSKGMKSMQLYSYYKLDKDKQKLRFTIHFLVGPGRAFRLLPSSLDIQNKAGEWREVPLENKPTLAIVEGIYRNKNPYESLVEGLPFK
ncbi:MAG: hypothetical protein QNK37_10610 [Acidobacteriota bacterium]|nr:hypothetical protein [Acidobacteriota bacterium]